MITTDTVFIIGAGGSKPYGYSLGWELKEYLYSLKYKSFIKYRDDENHNNDTEINPIFDLDKVTQFQKIFSGTGKDISIDKFLSMNKSNPDYNEIGRFGIIKHISDCEMKSNQALHIHNDKDWISLLIDKMTEDIEDENGFEYFAENKIHFITFNYDRSLEYYLFDAFKNCYYTTCGGKHFSKTKPEDFFKFDFIHLYGCIAPLLW